jgi:hypothetical protein
MSTFIYLFTQTTHIMCACTRYVNCVRVTFALFYIFSNVIPQVHSLFNGTLIKRFLKIAIAIFENIPTDNACLFIKQQYTTLAAFYLTTR